MRYKLRRPTDPEVNWLFTLIVIGWGGVIGSTITVLLAGAMLWNLVALAIGRLNLDVQREARLAAAAFAAYFLAVTLADLVNYEHPQVLIKFVENLPFLGFILFYASLAKCSRDNIAIAVQSGAVTGAYATFAVALFEVAYLREYRAAGGAGNSGPFATIAALLYCLCLMTAARQQGWARMPAIVAAACAAGALLLSGMRGIWPIIMIGPLIPLLVYRRPLHILQPRRTLALGAVLVAGIAFVSFDTVFQRVAQIADDYERITTQADYNNSVGHRLIVWDTGLDLVLEKPLLGHGSSDIPALMAERTQERWGIAMGYSHFHNFLLNEAVRSGLVGLGAMLGMILGPLWLALRRPRDDVADFGFAMMLSVHATFILSGMTNIMLHHDIMDTLFIFGTVTACFLTFRRDAATPDSAARFGPVQSLSKK